MFVQLLLIAIAGVTYIFYMGWKKMSFFRNLGIPEDPGTYPIGSQPQWELFSGNLAFVNLFDKQYKQFEGLKMYGWYGTFGLPQLVVQDMDLVKDVLIKDFDHFVDRREFTFGSNKYLANMLTILKGEKWKAMRTLMSPVFTSGKLKLMVPLIDKVVFI